KETQSDNQRGAKAAQRVAAKVHDRFLPFNASRNGIASRSGSVAAMLHGAEKCILPKSRRTDFVWPHFGNSIPAGSGGGVCRPQTALGMPTCRTVPHQASASHQSHSPKH